jgi:hypothetical protein
MDILDRLIMALNTLSHLGELYQGHYVGADGGASLVVMLILMIVSTALQLLLAPKPPSAKAATLEDFDVPTAEQDRPIPVIFGTVWITGPNVVWYGDLRTEGIPAPGGKK